MRGRRGRGLGNVWERGQEERKDRDEREGVGG